MRLLLIGDSSLALHAVATLLRDENGAEVRAAVQVTEVEAAISRWQPEIVIAEISDAAVSEDALRAMQPILGAIPLLVIAPQEVSQVLAALRSGAHGFVGRDTSVGELLASIATVLAGEWALPQRFVGGLAEAYVRLSRQAPSPQL